jgi:hypothetical protein
MIPKRPIGLYDGELAGHAEVQHQDRVTVQVEQEVFGSPPDAEDAAALYEPPELARVDAHAKARLADGNTLEPPPDHVRQERAPYRLDFR